MGSIHWRQELEDPELQELPLRTPEREGMPKDFGYRLRNGVANISKNSNTNIGINLYLKLLFYSVDSMLLLEEGFDVTSVDASDKMLKYALKSRWNRRKDPKYDRWGILNIYLSLFRLLIYFPKCDNPKVKVELKHNLCVTFALTCD